MSTGLSPKLRPMRTAFLQGIGNSCGSYRDSLWLKTREVYSNPSALHSVRTFPHSVQRWAGLVECGGNRGKPASRKDGPPFNTAPPLRRKSGAVVSSVALLLLGGMIIVFVFVDLLGDFILLGVDLGALLCRQMAAVGCAVLRDLPVDAAFPLLEIGGFAGVQ